MKRAGQPGYAEGSAHSENAPRGTDSAGTRVILTQPDPKRKRIYRRNAILGTMIGLIIAAGGIIGVTRVSVDSLKPRIETALTRATGRQVLIHGPVKLLISLRPTVSATDVTVANPPGSSRPDMARIGSLEVQFALLPLLRHALTIDRLVLERPNILLERTSQGQPNWENAPALNTRVWAGSASSPKPAHPYALSLEQLRIEKGKIAYLDDRTDHIAAVDIPDLSLGAPSRTQPLKLNADLAVNGLKLKVAAETGSLAALQDPALAGPWPVSGTISAADASVSFDGAIARPLSLRGYEMKLQGDVPDLATLRPLAPNAGLPALHDVSFAAQIADSGGPMPVISAFSFRSGAGDLAPLAPGATITQSSLTAPAADQPIRADLHGTWAGSPLSLSGTLGPVSKLLAGQPGEPLPIDIAVQSGASSLAVRGGVADPVHLSGLDLAVTAATPDLSQLSGLTRTALPRLTDIRLSGQLRDTGGLLKGIRVSSLHFSSTQGDLAGDVAIAPGRPPAISGQLTSDRLDLDAMRAVLALSAAGAALSAAPVPEPARRPPAPQSAPAGLFPDTPLPFGQLDASDADLRLTIGTLTAAGEAWRDVHLLLTLHHGRLHVDPFTATLPAGKLNASFTADANTASPAVALRLNAPAVGLKPLLVAFGQQPFASGTANIQADLHGSGSTPHAIASTLNGTFSLTMAGGQIDATLLEKALGPVIARVNAAALLVHGGSSDIRCLVARFSATNGVATLNPFLLASSLITVDGSGTLNLGSETLNLHLHPHGRVGGTGFQVPLTLTGPFSNPQVALNETGAAASGVEVVIGALMGKKAAGILDQPAPSCSGEVAAAHGPAPAPPAPSHPALPQKLPNAGALLRQLIR